MNSRNGLNNAELIATIAAAERFQKQIDQDAYSKNTEP